MSTPVYNEVGRKYNTTRRADPYIADRLYALLEPVPGGRYLDIGCGTGNYLRALRDRGLRMTGADPSQVMLSAARQQDPDAELVEAYAEALPFPDGMFDGAIAVLTLHHWDDIGRGLAQVYRVLKPGGRLVCFSFTPEQVRGYWLSHYFPRMMARSAVVIPAPEEMMALLNGAGFRLTKTEKYFVHEGLQDQFLYAHKERPDQYLRPEVRAGISSFTVFSEPEELESGLSALSGDIASGKVREVMKAYSGEAGDYLFLSAVRPA